MDEAFVGTDHRALVEGRAVSSRVIGGAGVGGQSRCGVDGVAHRFPLGGAIHVEATDEIE
ncbi:hypothetical protein D3C78_1646840 [compost metagenome]